MKKSVKVLALVMVALMLCMSFASCAKKLSGEYVNDATIAGSGIVTTYEFSGNKVTLTVETKALGVVVEEGTASREGTYSIGEDKITFEFEGDDTVAKEYSKTLDFEEGEDYIKIGIVKFDKKDK
ncbi:MAG: hypothetical protein J6A83_02905 [Clostridia bacterium]|nr:hypothetical protein [Clostridia bacterium]